MSDVDRLALAERIAGHLGPFNFVTREERDLIVTALRADRRDEAVETPGAKWRAEGKPDPHGDRYDCERARLDGGSMTDDEVANAVFLDPSIGNLTIAKDRIRWLSRQLVTVTHPTESQGGQLRDPKDGLSAFSVLKDHFPELTPVRSAAQPMREALQLARNWIDPHGDPIADSSREVLAVINAVLTPASPNEGKDEAGAHHLNSQGSASHE